MENIGVVVDFGFTFNFLTSLKNANRMESMWLLWKACDVGRTRQNTLISFIVKWFFTQSIASAFPEIVTLSASLTEATVSTQSSPRSTSKLFTSDSDMPIYICESRKQILSKTNILHDIMATCLLLNYRFPGFVNLWFIRVI